MAENLDGLATYNLLNTESPDWDAFLGSDVSNLNKIVPLVADMRPNDSNNWLRTKDFASFGPNSHIEIGVVPNWYWHLSLKNYNAGAVSN